MLKTGLMGTAVVDNTAVIDGMADMKDAMAMIKGEEATTETHEVIAQTEAIHVAIAVIGMTMAIAAIGMNVTETADKACSISVAGERTARSENVP